MSCCCCVMYDVIKAYFYAVCFLGTLFELKAIPRSNTHPCIPSFKMKRVECGNIMVASLCKRW